MESSEHITEVEPGWGSLLPPIPQDAAQAPFPMESLPPQFADYLQMGLTLTDITAGAEPMAFMALCAAIGMLAAADMLIELRPGELAPFSVHAYGEMGSGDRKTALMRQYMRGHYSADAAAHRAYELTKERQSRWDAQPKADRRGERPVLPPYSHKRIFGDITIEALLDRAGKGDPFVSVISSEATAHLNNHSYRNANAAVRTNAILNDLFSDGTASVGRKSGDMGDRTISADGVAVTILLLTQIEGRAFTRIMGDEGVTGATARALIASCSDVWLEDDVGSSDERALALREYLARVIRQRRELQDDTLLRSYPEKPERKTIRATDAAAKVVTEFAGECREQRRAESNAHMRTRLGRGGEYLMRIAAVFAAFRHYIDGAKNLQITAADAIAARSVTKWQNAELRRLSARTDADEIAQAANDLLATIQDEYRKWDEGMGDSRYINAEGLLLIGRLCGQRGPSGWRESTRYPTLLSVLESAEVNALKRMPGKRGRARVHPAIVAGADIG